MTILGVTPVAGNVLLVIDHEEYVLSAEMSSDEAARLVRMLATGIARAEAWRPAETLAEMLGEEDL